MTQIETQRFQHLRNPSAQELYVNPVDTRIETPRKSPIFASYKEVVCDPVRLLEAKNILSFLLDLRNKGEATRRMVVLQNIREIILPDDQINPNSKKGFLEIEFSVPHGLATDHELLRQIKEFYAREVFKESTGTFDEEKRNKNELPKYLVARLWNYDSLDKTENKLISNKKRKGEGEQIEQLEEKEQFLDLKKQDRRTNPQTGSVLFIGREEDFEDSDIYRITKGKQRYTDDVSAVPGILFYEPRPQKLMNEFLKPFKRLPVEVKDCEISKRIVLRLPLSRYGSLEMEELDLYFVTLLLSDILAGRVEYKVDETHIGSVGGNYKKEISAILAGLNSSRYKNLSLETLPGIKNIIEVIQEQLLEPLVAGKLDEAQDIMLVGAPGTGKTALTTALSRMDTGVAMISISSKQFLGNGSEIVDHLAKFHDRYGLNAVLILQDAEALFTDKLFFGSEGKGAPVDPEKRQFVLELLGGERRSQVKFLLTINRPGYIDEALRRRFLTIYMGLPDKGNVELYREMAEASLRRLNFDLDLDGAKDWLVSSIVKASQGYPPAFVAKLAEMVIISLGKLNGQLSDSNQLQQLVGQRAQILKDGYPIEEIRNLDKVAQKVAAQTRYP